MFNEEIITKELLFNSIFVEIPIGLFWKDKDRKFLGVNKIFLEYYGIESEEDIIGKTDEDMGWHINPEHFKSLEEKLLSDGTPIINVYGECIVKGDIRKIKASKYPIRNDKGEIIGLIGVFEDITKEAAERDKLFALSHRDELTDLFNRRAYGEISKKYEAEYKITGADFALYMIDLNDFKSINDTFGHEFGNAVLKSACESLKTVAKDNSVAFRYGGDEFVVLHQIKNIKQAEKLKDEIINAIKIPKIIEGIEINISVSIGYDIFSKEKDLSQLIESADKKMYEMKQKLKLQKYDKLTYSHG